MRRIFKAKRTRKYKLLIFLIITILSVFVSNKVINNLSKEYIISGKLEKFNINIDKEKFLLKMGLNYKKINKVTASENYLNIYESFGYFVSNGNNSYNVYDNALKQNVLTTYSGNVNDFNNTDLLKEYKWTYKKDANGNYYFVSLSYSK